MHWWSCLLLSSAAVLYRGGEALEADSCRKSSHSWRASGSPRLICLTSNVTNHLGAGNISLSSSLSLFSFPSFSLFVPLSLSPPPSAPPPPLLPGRCFRCHFTPENEWKTREQRDGNVLFPSSPPAGHHRSNDDDEARGRAPLLLSLSVSKHRCHSRSSALQGVNGG